jgi:hypothetical protein
MSTHRGLQGCENNADLVIVKQRCGVIDGASMVAATRSGESVQPVASAAVWIADKRSLFEAAGSGQGQWPTCRQRAGKGVCASMSEEPLSNAPGSPSADSAPEAGSTSDERALGRAERRAERRDRRGRGAPWILGAILIVLGVGFLLQAFGRIAFNNWWALFILIPAVGSFAAAWRRYQAAGGVTAGVLGSVIGGVVLSAVSLAFLFNLNLGLNWNLFWPLLLILGGVALLLQYAIR